MTTAAGPRPLRLANSSEPPSTPSTPSSPFTPTSRVGFASRTPNPRRQSSISYIPSLRDGEPTSPALFNPRHASVHVSPKSPDPPILSSPKPLNRSLSVGSRRSVDGIPTRTFATPTTPVSERGTNGSRFNSKRISTGSMLEPTVEERERGPLTLVEKHADLLHFIAQKESKCLELRTQLAAHEAELLELKKKWERIVSRGLERSQSQTPASSVPPESQSSASPLSLNSPPSNSIPKSTTGQPLSNVYSPASLSYLENLSTQAQGVGGASMLEALGVGGMKGIRDSVQQGVERILGVVAGSEPISSQSSSVKPKSSTHNSSQSTSSVATASSSTSFFSASSDAGARLSYSSQSSVDVIPEEGQNDAKRKRRPAGLSAFTDTGATPLTSPTSEFGFDFENPSMVSNSTSVSRSNSTRSRRRKKTSSVDQSEENSSPEENSKGHPKPDSISMSLLDWSSVEDSSALREAKQMNNYAKRISLPPLDGSGMSSWVGNMVGKTWEEKINKNQKRASVILSDVSHTISQLVSPAQPTPTTSHTRREPSLLDDDLPDSENGDALRSVPLLKPSTPTPSTPLQLETPKKTTSTSSKPLPSNQRQDDDEDEWNW